MKIKKFIPILLFVLIFAAVAVVPVFAQGENPPAAPVSPLSLPVELQAMVAALIGYLVTQGIKSLSAMIGSDLSGWSAALTASVVTTIIYLITALLSAIPVSAQPSVAIGLTLLVSILGAFGIHNTVKSRAS
jgi:hypothetical protein